MNPEVLVGNARRRRRSAPQPVIPPPPNIRNWIVYSALTAGVAALMFSGSLIDTPTTQPLPDLSEATDVRSTVQEAAESLQVVVGWDLTLSQPGGVPDSVRVRVIGESSDTLTLTQHGAELADTAYLPMPETGQTVRGSSCVAAQHGWEHPMQEVCTPWQYVRPVASANAGISPSAAPARIVVQPNGLQVDPDVGGRCAEWQRANPEVSVWIETNLTAVPACTGPNQKPVVAQFCAFVVMPDGRRLKTANSTNNRYCDELFAEWTRERYS